MVWRTVRVRFTLFTLSVVVWDRRWMRFCSLLVESCSDGTDERIGSDGWNRTACVLLPRKYCASRRASGGRAFGDGFGRAKSASRGGLRSGKREPRTRHEWRRGNHHRTDGWMDGCGVVVVVVRARRRGGGCAPVVKGASLRRDVYFT